MARERGSIPFDSVGVGRLAEKTRLTIAEAGVVWSGVVAGIAAKQLYYFDVDTRVVRVDDVTVLCERICTELGLKAREVEQARETLRRIKLSDLEAVLAQLLRDDPECLWQPSDASPCGPDVLGDIWASAGRGLRQRSQQFTNRRKG